ncbi:MAG: toxin HipA [Bifidobacterium breve]|nr:toxin HipA [Bifidobacterium breve]
MPRKLIMCGDHPVLAFEYDPESGRACSSGEVLDHDRLPLEFTTHGKSALYAKRIDEWWRSRAIPSTRDGIRRVLESLGAASTGELLDRTYGLSLSDQYWVRREDDPVEWKDVNFFDNPFDEALGEILLTSYSSSHDISLNVPDVSTGGDLPKRWTIDRATGRRLLVKSGRTGQEPMNEVIASRLCMRLGVPAVRYSLARNGNRLVSTCADMLSNHEELVSAWQVLQNIETLAVRPAPIYDTGASLWSGELDVDDRDWFAKPFYSATGRPSALRQLKLVEDWGRFDLDALSGWPDEVAHELSRMRMFAPERLDAIRVQLVKRIGMLRRISEGEVLRVSGPIRNKTDLMDRFGETLWKNLGQRDGDARSVGTGPDALSRHLNR